MEVVAAVVAPVMTADKEIVAMMVVKVANSQKMK